MNPSFKSTNTSPFHRPRQQRKEEEERISSSSSLSSTPRSPLVQRNLYSSINPPPPPQYFKPIVLIPPALSPPPLFRASTTDDAPVKEQPKDREEKQQQCKKNNKKSSSSLPSSPSPLPLWSPIDYSAIHDSADEILHLLAREEMTGCSQVPPPSLVANTSSLHGPCCFAPTTPRSGYSSLAVSPLVSPIGMTKKKLGRWTPEEDALLIHAITILGGPPFNWNKISKDFFHGSRLRLAQRTQQACRQVSIEENTITGSTQNDP